MIISNPGVPFENTGDMLLDNVQTVTAAKLFDSGTLKLNGEISGTATLIPNDNAGSGIITLPVSGTLSTTDEVNLKQNRFVGISVNTPITENDILFDYDTRVLTIVPPLGYLDLFISASSDIVIDIGSESTDVLFTSLAPGEWHVTSSLGYDEYFTVIDGDNTINAESISGVVTLSPTIPISYRTNFYRKTGNISFPAMTDTSGFWYFYFNYLGEPITSQTVWNSFLVNVSVYKIYWNSTQTGSLKSISEGIEFHHGSVPEVDRTYKHYVFGAMHKSGFDLASNAILSGTPDTSGLNTVIGMSSGTYFDDNIEITVTNDAGAGYFKQALGDTRSAVISISNSAIISKIRTVSGKGENIAGDRFPFCWHQTADADINRPTYIAANGTCTLVTNNYYFTYFVFVYQDRRNGQAVRLVSAPNEYELISQAEAVKWANIVSTYPGLGDREVRPLYQLIFQYNSTYDSAIKYTALREVFDLRKGSVNLPSIISTIPATSISFLPSGDISATDLYNAVLELDREKLPVIGKTITQAISLVQESDFLPFTITSRINSAPSLRGMAFISSRGTDSAPSATQLNDALGNIFFYGYGDNAITAACARIGAAASENFTNSAHGSHLIFSTTPIGSITRAERMRILNSGFIGIGLAAPTTLLEILGVTQNWGTQITARGQLNIADSASQADGTGGALTLGGKYDSSNYTVFGAVRGEKDTASSGSARGRLCLYTSTAVGLLTERMRIDYLGNVGIGITPTKNLSFSGQSAQTIGLERNSTSNTAGVNGTLILGGGATSGATDKDGGMGTIEPGQTTGMGKSSIRLVSYDRAATSGTADNTKADRIIIPSVINLSNGASKSIFEIALPSGACGGGNINYSIIATDGTDSEIVVGQEEFTCINKGGSFTTNKVYYTKSSIKTHNGASMTVTTALNESANKVTFAITATSTLTPTSMKFRYVITNLSAQAITQL